MIVGKRILIIGGTGSLGNILTKRWIANNFIIIFSRDENKQWAMRMKYSKSANNIKFYVGDMRNTKSLRSCFNQYEPDIIVIAAALKQIDTCETFVNECVATNVTGIQNVLQVLNSLSVCAETVLFVSTDKASAPVNVYGMCKGIGERLMVNAASNCKDRTKFVCVRYGNVVNSRGSIVPKFVEIMESKEEQFLPVTHPDMTRFLMSLDQCHEIIEYAIETAKSGDIVIPKIPSFKILDIAAWFALKCQKEIKIVGIRPGEKLHETLINISEISRTIVSPDNKYFVIKPDYLKDPILVQEYSSQDNINTDLSGFVKLLENDIHQESV
jgi:FlaA1/EpsC-like NDP-sugar epimerase